MLGTSLPSLPPPFKSSSIQGCLREGSSAASTPWETWEAAELLPLLLSSSSGEMPCFSAQQGGGEGGKGGGMRQR